MDIIGGIWAQVQHHRAGVATGHGWFLWVSRVDRRDTSDPKAPFSAIRRRSV